MQEANSVLRRNLRHYHGRVIIDVYSSFVKPILNCSAPAWTPHTDYCIKKLEAIQKHAAQFIIS